MTSSGSRVVVITGANKGLGFELARQLGKKGYHIVLAARQRKDAEEAARLLAAESIIVVPEVLEITDAASVAAFASRRSRVDVLVNNAGGFFDAHHHASDVPPDYFREAFDTNVLGAVRVTQALLPLLRKSAPAARIVNVASQAGSLTDPYGMPDGTLPAYAATKAALNAFTQKLAAELKGSGILVNSVCPGFTATKPGLAELGARPVSDGAASIAYAVTLPDNGPTGGFYRDGKPLAW
jgi:NAD(P)-dependent dehydrogenase (short-subunit alcohol dehydrogenase family)